MANDSFYELSPTTWNGEQFPFSQLRGKVVLIVNVASQCGFTKQYGDLQRLYEKYESEGLVILGFPCNQFGNQEPGTDAEIHEFCSVNFGVTFPIMKKIDVNGHQADPVYQYIKTKKRGLLGFSGIKWNFEKFLVNREGEVTNRWCSAVSVSQMEHVVKKALGCA
ncbi:hypothetical protein DASB73_038700 [Starmerella bacillaris]|uniref:Glutathione peroxidase n=1 Tax=Starmerella bacillaris TaxID=1247836 RepID=A0AAV5RNQ5_STABA|nr:hypothetical protein DASB73_038700 [Starmerella bacillaris]